MPYRLLTQALLKRACAALVLLGVVFDAAAEPPVPLAKPAPLVRLPAAQLRDLAPRLRAGDIALMESDAQGFQRQITVISLVAAEPAAVREVVVHPERFGEFVRNMTESKATRNPDGTVDHMWRLSYSILALDSLNRYTFLPPSPEYAAAPVDLVDLYGPSHYRWEFIAPSTGGGTIVVLYGYTDSRHPSEGTFLSKVISRAESLEYGLALVTQMTLLLSVKERARQRPGQFAPYAAPADPAPPNIDSMLDRGVVVVFRTQQGRLSELTLIGRSRAPAASLLLTAGRPELFSQFVPCVSRSQGLGQRDGAALVDLELSLPLMAWRSTFAVLRTPSAIDMLGVSGDLHGARMRWDVRERQGRRELIMRANTPFERSSIIMRQLYKLEPLLEYGVNAGLAWNILQAITARAEASSAAPLPAIRPAQ